jgi:hypothetical protein
VSASGLTGAGASLAVSKAAPQRSLFTTQTPAVANASDQIPYELGMKFRVARSGQILAVRYWKSANDTARTSAVSGLRPVHYSRQCRF